MKLKVGGISPRRSGTRHAAGNNEDNAIEKGYYSYLWLIVLLPSSFSFFSDSADCFDFSRVLRRNVSSRFLSGMKYSFFFARKKKEKKQRREEKGRKRKIWKENTRINWLAPRGRGLRFRKAKVSEGCEKECATAAFARFPFIERENSVDRFAAHLSDNAYRLIERLVLGTGCVLVASRSIKPRSTPIRRGYPSRFWIFHKLGKKCRDPAFDVQSRLHWYASCCYSRIKNSSRRGGREGGGIFSKNFDDHKIP